MTYFVSCTNEILNYPQSYTFVYNLHPNTQYPCYVYGIDNLGRLSEGADFNFRTDKIGKLLCLFVDLRVCMVLLYLSFLRLPLGTFRFNFYYYAAPLFAPHGFQYTLINSTSVQLTWEPPPVDERSGTITYYCLTFSCRSCNRMTNSTSETRYEKSQLHPGLEYNISVVACTSRTGCGSTESTLTVILPPAAGIYLLSL